LLRFHRRNKYKLGMRLVISLVLFLKINNSDFSIFSV